MRKKKSKAKTGQYAAIGIVIRKAREKKGLTQSEMGRRLGITRQGYAHYELGGALPPAVEISKLCQILDLDAGSFGHAASVTKLPLPDDAALLFLHNIWSALEDDDRRAVVEAAEGRLARRGIPFEGFVHRKRNGTPDTV